MDNQTEIENIRKAILSLEAQRQSLGDAIVDTALAPLRNRLDALLAGRHYEQRKLVTILFADLVGSTELSAQMDPEDMRELLNTYFSRCRMSVERHGGVVEKFIGDAVMAVFGLPLSKEDDPERAVRAGLEIARVPEQLEAGPFHGLPGSFATRVGINTGEVVIGALGERLKDELVVVGDPVNLASRVQNAAPPAGVLITHGTYRHVRGVFAVQPIEPLQLKGIGHPVKAYLVEGARPRTYRMPRRGIEGVETHVVGRSEEIASLREALRLAVREVQCKTLTVVGDAGIGKSRLVEEFEAWLEGLPEKVFYLKGRAHPSGQTSPYSLVRDLFALRFQIQDSDQPPEVRRKLEHGYAEAFLPTRGHDGEEQPRPRVRAAHVLGRLLGFEFGPSDHVGASGGDARGLHDEALANLREYFEALGQRHPVVVVLEDLHWGDDSSLDLVQRLVASLASLPLFVVCTARPSLFERRPGWPEGLREAGHLDLGPLSRQDSSALVGQILRTADDPPKELADLVVDTAEGNPFYIEELLKMLLEEGVIRAGGGRWEVDRGRLSAVCVPPTLTGVLQARLDSLASDERAYLQRGSVIGRVFWDRAIEYLELAGNADGGRESSSPDAPDMLRQREMIFERERSTFEDTREFLFKHALLRDVTYDTLLKRERRALHRQTARWLEQVTERSERSEEFAALIAGHYEQAHDAESAAEWFLRAGMAAASRYANAEAVHALTRALDLTPGNDKERQFEICLSREAVFGLQGMTDERLRELQALQEVADALADPGRQAIAALRAAAYALSVADFPTAVSAAEEAAELANISNDIAVAAESELVLADALARQGSLAAARDHVLRSLERARQRHLPRLEGKTLRQLGLIAYYMGDHQEARERFAAALELFVALGDKQGEASAVNNLGGVTSELGDYGQATAYYWRSLDLCREIGDRVGEARALNNLGVAAVVEGDYPRAEDHYLRALQICREVGQRSFEMSALDNLGNLALYRYEFSRAKDYQLESLKGAREIGDRVAEGFSLGNLARGCLMLGDWERAFGYISSALELVRQIGDHQGECDLMIRLGEYHCATAAADVALVDAQQALDLARRHGFQSEVASALHVLGEAALSSGDAEGACESFRAALEGRRRLEQKAEACDSQAGLAKALLTLGHLEEAMAEVNELLQIWDHRGFFGLNRPGLDLFTAYRVLAAARDPRAGGVLQQGYRLLQESASSIDDVTLRQSFLNDLPSNRELAETWKRVGIQEGRIG